MKTEAETQNQPAPAQDEMVVTFAICPVPVCATIFVMLADDQRFCSPSCRAAWEAIGATEPEPRPFFLTLRHCRLCRALFPIHVPHQRYCGPACKQSYDNNYRGHE